MTHPIRSNPPLVEVVAEVRWGQGLVGLAQAFVETDDAEYIKLGAEVSKLGYNQFERVLPSGFPSPTGAVVYRYRKADESQHTLFQLGAGVFTANALPPYSSWHDFRATIGSGLNAAYAAGVIPAGEPYQLILRYIDAFSGPSLCGRSPYGLMVDMLALRFENPAAAGTPPVTARLSLEYQVAGDRSLGIEMAQARRGTDDALIMNTRVNSEGVESPTVEDLLTTFDDLHTALRDVYEEMIDRVKVDEASDD